MQVVVPSILTEACGLSAGVSATALALGFLLWLLGWRSHRFWIVLVATVSAGSFGLYSGPAYGTHPVVAGLLLALAAGTLALALARVLAFAAAGGTVWLVLRAVAPGWQEPLVCFLVGGLIGLLLFRVWTMALTSSAGALLMGYSGLCLAHALGKLDVVAWSEKHSTLLNSLWGGAALAGLLMQYLLERWQGRFWRREPRAEGRFVPGNAGRSRYSWAERALRRAG